MQLMNMAQKMKSNGNFNNKDAQEIFKILIGKNY